MRQPSLVSHFVETGAVARPGKTALIHHGRRLTYAEIDGMATALAATLADRGVQRGDRVAIFMDNAVEAVVSIFGVLKANAAFTLVNPGTKSGKLEFILRDSRAAALLTQAARLPVARAISSPHLRVTVVAGLGPGASRAQGQLDGPAAAAAIPLLSYEDAITTPPPRAPRPRCIDLDLAALIYTSGSTGTPKGVMLSHRNIVSVAQSITEYLENTSDDVILNVLPLAFDYGLYQVLMAFKVGGTVVLEKSFNYPYEVVQSISREGVTGFPGVPTIFAILLSLKNLPAWNFSSLRYMTNTAAALPAAHVRRLRELFPHVRIYSMYGLTECKRVSYLPPEELDRRPTSVGRGMPNEEVYLVDAAGNRLPDGSTGELVVRGSNVMLGYWDLPEETAACLRPGPYPGEQVLHTGDIFRSDEEGFLYFLGRRDEMIKTGGQKVSPVEIENVLHSLEGVVEAAVVGVPDAILGEVIVACVSLRTGVILSEREILGHCVDSLEHHLIPRRVVILDSLPRTASGKINKRELMEWDAFKSGVCAREWTGA